MSQTEQRAAVITGVSTGIGRAIAEALIASGWRVFGSVRKERDAKEAQDALGAAFSPLVFDVTDREAVFREAAAVRAALGGRRLQGLVNNAGIGVGGPIELLPEEELRRQLDINLFGPLRVTQAFLPLLGVDASLAGPKGRIVNMSSVAGRIATPFTGPYAMSKHALEAFTDSLRREMMMFGVDAVAIGPGAVRTPIWGKADDLDVERYRGSVYWPAIERMQRAMKRVGEEGIEASEVGALVRDVLEGRRKKARYAILGNRLTNWILPNILPKRMIDRALARRFGLDAKGA